MPDPFASLRSPVTPVEPDPAFAIRLRARVERALSLPKGVIVSETTLDPDTTLDPGVPAGAPPASALTPYLIVTDARRAIDWYATVFGARRRGDPYVMDDGRIGHAELDLGPGLVYLADESAESHVAAPAPDAPTPVTLVLEVADVDGVVGRAVDAGASVERPAADHPYGRNAVLRDPFHHRWMVSSPVPWEEAGPAAAPSAPMRQGDVGYASLFVPDLARAEAFFAAVLGWRSEPGSTPEGRQLVGTAPHQGLWGGQERATLFLCFAVDDVDAAVERVRAAGGEAQAPTEQPYGRIADCVDDQGTPFALFRPPPDEPLPRGPAHGAAQGDLAYVTMEVPDATRARAFYGTVLGWRFNPGRVPDGWQLEDVHPGIGLRGGQEVGTAVPMYRVDDIEAAVARVRAAGGAATDPERQPYGLQATCTDDQGTRFFLGQL